VSVVAVSPRLIRGRLNREWDEALLIILGFTPWAIRDPFQSG
jgi:hypothetical protein